MMVHKRMVLAAASAAAFVLYPHAAPGQAAAPPVDMEPERAAILETIQGESTAFWDKDFDRWKSYWVQSPHARIMGWWAAGGVSVTEGWDAIAGGMRTLMRENPEPNPTAALVRRENLNVRILGDMALVTFDQYGTNTGDERMDMPGLSRETRVLEKHDGQWKIAYVGWLLEGERNGK